jgi:hypothetical protein
MQALHMGPAVTYAFIALNSRYLKQTANAVSFAGKTESKLMQGENDGRTVEADVLKRIKICCM